MKNIFIFCNAGMSTSILEKGIAKELKSQNRERLVRAYDVSKINKVVESGDVILLGPQIGHMNKQITEEHPSNIVIQLEMLEFGTMDYKGIIKKIENNGGLDE